jgi:hypothetical protein
MLLLGNPSYTLDYFYPHSFCPYTTLNDFPQNSITKKSQTSFHPLEHVPLIFFQRRFLLNRITLDRAQLVGFLRIEFSIVIV